MSERADCAHGRVFIEIFNGGTWTFCLNCNDEGGVIEAPSAIGVFP